MEKIKKNKILFQSKFLPRPTVPVGFEKSATICVSSSTLKVKFKIKIEIKSRLHCIDIASNKI